MTKIRSLRWFALALLASTLLAWALPALAQDGGSVPVTDDMVNAIAKKLYCPVCENVPLDVCPTQACADWRGEIRTMLEQGQTEPQILDHFAMNYGQRVLATPQAAGFNGLVWTLPLVGLLAGMVVLGVVLWRIAPGALSAQVEAKSTLYEDIDPAYMARLEADLKDFNV
jgi:cytochrome c-type biogenesis protein CcmH